MTRLRAMITKKLPRGYEEAVTRNMLVYQVPLARYSDTYNGQPLWYLALASQKSGLSLHLMPMYWDATVSARVKQAFRDASKKCDIGKACIRFKSADDLPLDVIGDVIASTPVDRWVAIAEAARRR